MGDRAHVLVVDDNVDAREILRDFLMYEGFVVDGFANGREALDFLTVARRVPDVIILDMLMPVMDGRAFCEQLQADRRWSAIPVLVISASEQVKLPQGIAGVLRKPAELSEIIACIRRILPREQGVG